MRLGRVIIGELKTNRVQIFVVYFYIAGSVGLTTHGQKPAQYFLGCVVFNHSRIHIPKAYLHFTGIYSSINIGLARPCREYWFVAGSCFVKVFKEFRVELVLLDYKWLLGNISSHRI